MSSTVQQDRERLLSILKQDAFATGDFILSSGKKSSYYLDARKVSLSAEGAYLCARVMLDMVKGDQVEAIGGPTLGADPMVGAVASLSFQQGTPYKSFIIRKEPKGHGKGKMIEGPDWSKSPRIVIIDDVATTGKAFVHSIKALAEDGVKPVKCLCIVDRGEGAHEALAEYGVPLESIFTINDFLDSSAS